MTSLGLLAIGTLIVDTLATYVLSYSPIYSAYKYQNTLDFATLPAGLVVGRTHEIVDEEGPRLRPRGAASVINQTTYGALDQSHGSGSGSGSSGNDGGSLSTPLLSGH